MGRLNRTGKYVATAVFGTTAQAERAGRRVRAHARPAARDRPADRRGLPRRRRRLLRWVHITEVDSFLDAARRSGLVLTVDEVEQYQTEQLAYGGAGRPRPGDRAGYGRRGRGVLRRDRAEPRHDHGCGRGGLFLTMPPMPWGLGYTPARGIFMAVAALAVAMLPPWARKMYGLPGLSRPARSRR